MKISVALVSLSAVGLTGCGAVSEVIKVDSETYIVSSHGVVGNGAASAEEIKATQAASQYCKGRTGALKVLSVEKVDPFFGRAPSANIKFRCGE
jgi:hypothetical protein